MHELVRGNAEVSQAIWTGLAVHEWPRGQQQDRTLRLYYRCQSWHEQAQFAYARAGKQDFGQAMGWPAMAG